MMGRYCRLCLLAHQEVCKCLEVGIRSRQLHLGKVARCEHTQLGTIQGMAFRPFQVVHQWVHMYPSFDSHLRHMRSGNAFPLDHKTLDSMIGMDIHPSLVVH